LEAPKPDGARRAAGGRAPDHHRFRLPATAAGAGEEFPGGFSWESAAGAAGVVSGRVGRGEDGGEVGADAGVRLSRYQRAGSENWGFEFFDDGSGFGGWKSRW